MTRPKTTFLPSSFGRAFGGPNPCIYIYIYIYVYIYIYTYIYVYTHTSISVSLSLSLYIYIYICLSLSLYIYICIYIYTYIYIYIYIHTCIYIYIYIHIIGWSDQSFQQPTFLKFTRRQWCFGCTCSVLCVSSETMACRLLRWLLRPPYEAYKLTAH